MVAAQSASQTREEPQVGIEEIIVTAERREANVQQTPIAISAIGGETLQKKQIVDIEALAGRMPNVTFGRHSGSTKVFIRGIGLDAVAPGSDPRVAIYTDGVYSARSQVAFLGFYDIERVEVLAGPQGTLYGRNATAGAINIITRDPTQTLEGYGTATVGNYSLIRTEGAISGPLSDSISARLSFSTADRGGYGKNIQTGEDVDDEHRRAVRAKIKFEASSAFKLLLEADYYRAKDHNGGYHYLNDSPGHTAFSITRGFERPENVRDYAGQGPLQTIVNWGGSATATWNIGGPVLTSVTGYRRFEQDLAISSDLTTSGYIPNFIRERAKQFTQELRLTHSIGPVDILVGGYFFREQGFSGLHALPAPIFFGLNDQPGLPNTGQPIGAVYGGNQLTKAYAAFSQATIHVTDRFGIDLGLRYSFEKRKIVEHNVFNVTQPLNPLLPFFDPIPNLSTVIAQRASWKSTDPKITLHYKFGDGIFGYASYSQGFKSGGFNAGFLQAPFDPEDIKAYEVGLKADLFERRLRANVAGFWYDYKNLQVNVAEGVQIITRNAAAARLYGLEGQFTALPTDGLRLELSAAWLHSEYTDYVSGDPSFPGQGTPGLFLPSPSGPVPAFDLSGNQLAYAPKFKIDGEIGYTFQIPQGQVTPRLNVLWVDKVYFSQFNHPWVQQPARTEVNFFLDYASTKGDWTATAFVRNLTNKTYTVASTVFSDFIGYQVGGQLGAPRTYGISITKRF
ncbi:TonB-dependent receptor [Sphingobium phenoxybenzoativorans]|uniref:TonB-dependent receptor n=1 Tax=Sphingobium phenoxybenzoativorans TaxID=1592790 RepID=UPI000871EC18|nr:TonB-dependent receptor [Sphingobium phenoxybenzoativorans]